MRHQTITNDNRACKGCEQALTQTPSIAIGEYEKPQIKRSELTLQPITRDAWHQPSKRVRNVAPFTFGSSK